MAARTLDQLLESLQSDPNKEQLLSEIEVLQSIYGEDGGLSIWKPDPDNRSPSRLSNDAIRLDVRVALPPPHETIQFRLLVSMPSTYPATTPPQLQILSRYIGPFQVDSGLFGSALKTYISAGRVEFIPGEVAVFDGIENVKESVQRWYEDHLNAGAAAELLREDEKKHNNSATAETKDHVVEIPTVEQHPATDPTATELPDGVQIWVSEPIVDRKSTFIGRACEITHPSQVPLILAYLLNDKSTARAAHPVINAWRCEVNGLLHQDNDDDGETAAGGRLAHLLQILDVKNVLVIVTRHFGGVFLHNDRFKHINSVARAALELGGFLDAPDDPKRTGRVGQKGKGKA